MLQALNILSKQACCLITIALLLEFFIFKKILDNIKVYFCIVNIIYSSSFLRIYKFICTKHTLL